MDELVAGIDVSKKYSDLCLLSPQNHVIKELRIFHDLQSMQSAAEILNEFKRKYRSELVVIMESTAHYHRILLQFFMKTGFHVMIVNPLQTSSACNLNIRKVKNDKMDAKRIALMYRLNVYKGSILSNDILAVIKDLARQRMDLIDQMITFTNKITCLLDQAFPGYSKVFSKVKGKSSLAVLAKFPTPASVLQARKDSIMKVIGEASTRGKNSKFAAKKADLLIQTAKTAQAICIERESFSMLISMVAEMMISLQRAIDTLTDKINQLARENELLYHQVRLLATIPGIGEFSAIMLLAEFGDSKRFSKPKELVAYCGLDPAVKQSGTSVYGNSRISKRGSSYLRRILDICTHVAIHPGKKGIPANPILAEFYLFKCQTKPRKLAMCACMRKIVNIIFAVLRDQKPFELRTPEQHIQSRLICKKAA